MMCKTRWSNILAVIFGLGLANGYAIESMVGNSNSVENAESKTIVVQDAKEQTKESLKEVPSVEVASQRIIVKFKLSDKQKQRIMEAKNPVTGKPTKTARLKIEMMVKKEQMLPLTAQKLAELSKAAGYSLVDVTSYGDGGRVLEVKDKKPLTELQMNKVVNALNKVHGVLAIHNKKGFALAIPNTNQWYLYDENATASSGKGVYYGAGFYINQKQSFISATGKGVTVAVIDSGYLPHPDIIHNLQPLDDKSAVKQYGYTFGETASPGAIDTRAGHPSTAWHGTRVTSAIVGKGGNGEFVLGGAPDAKVVPVVPVDYEYARIADAILWASGLHPSIVNEHPAKVINMSFGVASGDGTCHFLQDVIDKVVQEGVIPVAAAGNSNINISEYLKYPIGTTMKIPQLCHGVIVVSGVNASRQRSSFSDYNYPTILIAAPAGYKLATDTTTRANMLLAYYNSSTGDSTYAYTGGTSFASPLVAAAVADMLSTNSNLSWAQVVEILQATATPFAKNENTCASQGLDKGCLGAGILNAGAAVEMAQSQAYQTKE